MTFTRYELTIPVELTSELHIGGVDEVPDRDGEGTVIRFNRNGLKEPKIQRLGTVKLSRRRLGSPYGAMTRTTLVDPPMIAGCQVMRRSLSGRVRSHSTLSLSLQTRR